MIKEKMQKMPKRKDRKYLVMSKTEDKILDQTKKYNLKDHAHLQTLTRSHVNKIKNQLERFFKVKENVKWTMEQERGMINPAALSRLASDRNYRSPFKERKKSDSKNIAVSILIDLSASMDGQKIEMAKVSAFALSSALLELQISFEVLGFTSMEDDKLFAVESKKRAAYSRSSERLEIHNFKSFTTPHLKGLTNIEAFEQNPDGEAVMIAANRLIKEKQKRKILFIFSDGEPATLDTSAGHLRHHLKEVVENIEKKTNIEIVAFGMQTTSVKSFYSNAIVVKDMSQFSSICMEKLSDILTEKIN
jgi:cobalamin biosynthesis protein CobT